MVCMNLQEFSTNSYYGLYEWVRIINNYFLLNLYYKYI